MNQLEFEVLDDLYFLTSFVDLQAKTQLQKETLLEVLDELKAKTYLKCFISPEEELEMHNIDIKGKGQHYWYLASKAGLLAHNSR